MDSAEARVESVRKASVAYRQTEMPAKSALETIYKTSFEKEIVDGVLIPFASRMLLIAIAKDEKTAHLLPARFAAVSGQGDKRKRIAYINRLDGVVERRLKKLRVRVLHINMLGITGLIAIPVPQQDVQEGEFSPDEAPLLGA